MGWGTMASAPLAPVGHLGTEAALDLLAEARAVVLEGGDVTVSLAAVDDLGGACAQVLVSLSRTLERRGNHLHLVDVPPGIAPILGWCGLPASGA